MRKREHRTHTGTIDGIHVLVESWPNGDVTIATRSDDWATWGPPVDLHAAPIEASELLA